MGFGMTFDGQMAARMKAYLQRMAQQERQDALTNPADIGSHWRKGSATVTAPFERDGGKPTDAPSTVPDVAAAVKRLAQADKGRTLMAAIDRLHARRSSNGKPVVYVPE